MAKEISYEVKVCLEKAAECDRRAVLAADQTHRETYMELARLWRDIAEQAKTLQRRLTRFA